MLNQNLQQFARLVESNNQIASRLQTASSQEKFTLIALEESKKNGLDLTAEDIQLLCINLSVGIYHNLSQDQLDGQLCWNMSGSDDEQNGGTTGQAC